MQIKIAVSLVIIWCSVCLPVQVLAGWGVERGRADEGDVARLLVDQLSMRMAENRIREAVSRPIAIERRKQLLGASDGGNVAGDAMDRIFEWWLKDVLAPAEAIADNPAASCAEAQVASQSLLGMMRQRALLGMSPEPDDSSSGASTARTKAASLDETWNRIMGRLTVRCQEEALDECIVTGRMEQILQTEFSFNSQNEKMGGTAGDGAWVDAALKQCAVYELHLVSTTKVPQIFSLAMVRDTKIKLEFASPPGGVVNALLSGTKLENLLQGETKGGSNPFFVSIKCSQPPIQVVCEASETLSPFRSRIHALDLKHREFYVDTNGVSAVRIVGDDKLRFELAEGIYGVNVLVKVPGAPSVPVPMKGIGYSFYTAHKKDRPAEGPGAGVTIRLERTTRGAYPVLFAFNYTDQNNEKGASASDSTEVELIHKPKPDPLPPRRTTPPRKPLRPVRRG